MKGIIIKVLGAFAITAVLAGCGAKVEVPPAHVGKVMTKNGYKEGTIPTSKFRLDPCWAYCDKLVTLNASDQSVSEKLKVFMPKDKLEMAFDIRATLSVDPSDYEQVFSKVGTVDSNNDGIFEIPLNTVYKTYAQNILMAEAREFLVNYSISEVASSREAINAELSQRLAKAISERTPFNVRYLGLADVDYPQIILEAQKNAAQRREMIEQENAQLEISKVQLSRQLQEQTMQRKIDVEKARAEAEVNKIMGDSMTKDYQTYQSFQIMNKMAESQNKVFMPVEMLTTVGGQLQLK